MNVNQGFQIIPPEKQIIQPSGSVYLMDVFDHSLLNLIDERLIKQGYFIIEQEEQDLLCKYPYFLKLREIRLIPSIQKLLDRQIAQLIKVDSDGSFSFLIMRVDQGDKYPFLLNDELNVNQSVKMILPRLLPLAILLDKFGEKYPGRSGVAPFFYGDKGRGDGSILCYDSNFDHHLLLPDSDFLYRYAYQDFKEQLVSQSISWNKRQEILYWRGSSTGDKEDDYQWRIMPRFRLCQLATEVVNKELFDIKITRITNRFSSPEVIEEIKNSGLTAPYTAAIDQVKYKYLIDIDGHGSTWTGLFLRLLTGSTVLKVNSERGFRQWFHNRLIPWENYVPIEPDFSNLEETVLYLKTHDELARKIGQAGQELAYSMTMENEINYALTVILQCLEDNRDLVQITLDLV
ncbi:glycosyl transferase family 90 [Cylindrospermopsis raciborskii]|jgi:hypothetical protein|uniref:glycosyl transferase family 90 n=1 Tax=Cylindrospermopsis raciborskii TaxID=77022 RepID=UPI001F4367A5|nr:glycosyl transferase family 90 [Cylindrospermopsis raciborskii]UJS04460.1 hypothetical protein L3I90_15515 [Cylindrospermopsis raciborskii KLL07]